MILQPFAENSIEHSFAGIERTGCILILFNKQGKELAITVIDNGKGLAVKEGGTARSIDTDHISRAGQIIKDRIYLLNSKLKTKARFSIENNKVEQGVLVKIHLPILYKDDVYA